MANEDIVFRASIDDGGKGGKSLTTLKKEFQALNKELSQAEEGTKKYQQTLQKLGAVKDEIGDLRATIDALNPEGRVQAFTKVANGLAGGFQAATGAAALFGVESEELQRTLLKVQAATAFAEGIKSVTSLKDAFQVLGTVIKANPIFAVVGILTAVAAAVVSLTEKTSDLEGEIRRESEAISENIKVLDRQLKLLEAQGASEEKLLEVKREKINLQIREIQNSVRLQREQLKELANGSSLLEQLTTLVTMGNTANALTNKRFEQAAKLAKELGDSEQKIADLKNDLLVEETRVEKKADDERKKRAQEEKDRREQAAYDAYQAEQDGIAREKKANDDKADRIFKAREKEIEDEEKERERLAKLEQEKSEREEKAEQYSRDQREKARKELEAEEIATAQRIEQAKRDIESAGFKSAQALSNLFFTTKLQRSKGDAQAELEIRKKQFKVEQAFSAVRATIDGYRAVTAALTIPPPFGPALAIANGVAAAAQVASILAAKFDGGQANFASINTGTPSVSSAPQIETQAPVIGQNSTQFNDAGQNLNFKVTAEVVETQSTAAQKRVAKLKNQATFP